MDRANDGKWPRRLPLEGREGLSSDFEVGSETDSSETDSSETDSSKKDRRTTEIIGPNGLTKFVSHKARFLMQTLLAVTDDGVRSGNLVPKRETMSEGFIEAEAKKLKLNCDLPPGWEVLTTKNWQIYYCDHNQKSTRWRRPDAVWLTTGVPKECFKG